MKPVTLRIGSGHVTEQGVTQRRLDSEPFDSRVHLPDPLAQFLAKIEHICKHQEKQVIHSYQFCSFEEPGSILACIINIQKLINHGCFSLKKNKNWYNDIIIIIFCVQTCLSTCMLFLLLWTLAGGSKNIERTDAHGSDTDSRQACQWRKERREEPWFWNGRQSWCCGMLCSGHTMAVAFL